MKFRRSTLTALLTLVSLSLVAVTAVGCGDDSEPDWSGKTIKLGSLFSTSGTGVAFGPQQLKAVQLAIEEVNADDGVNGARLELVQRNDQSDPDRSATLMRKLIEEDQAIAVLGPTFSNSAATADPVANQLSTTVLAVSNTGPGIVGNCDYPCDFSFRDSLGETAAIPANVASLMGTDQKVELAKIFHPEDDPFGETSAETARDAFADHDVKTTSVTTTADGRITGLRDDRFDVAMITASSGEVAARLIRQLRERYKFEGPILGGNAFNSQLAASEAGTVGEGAQSASAWFVGNESEENREFTAAYREAYDEEPDQFAAQAYTGVKLLAEAAEDATLGFSEVGSDRVALRDSLARVEEETPLGEFSFTEGHDVRQPIWILAMDGKGGYRLIEEVKPD